MKWISIKDRLPLESGQYLIYEEGIIDVIDYVKEKNKWFDFNVCGCEQPMTPIYWMPLPEKPNE